MREAARLRRLAAAAVVAGLLSGAVSVAPPTLSGARPPAAAGAEFLAERNGGRSADYPLLYQRPARIPATGEAVWVGKFWDRRAGRLEIVYRDAAGTVGGPELVRGRARAALARLSAFERKASHGLREAVSRAVTSGVRERPLAVAAWLDVDLEAAEAAVRARHPDVRWIGDRPVVNDLGAVRRIRAELWNARRNAIARAAAVVRAAVETRGGRVAYVSTSAPIIFLDIGPGAVAGIAQRTDIVSMGLEGTWQPSMTSASPAVEGNWTSGGGDSGAGVRVGVVEYHNVRRNGDLSGKVVKSYSTSGRLAYSPTFDHPTWVAGAIAGRGGTWRGVATGASIVSAGTGGYSPSLAYDRAIIRAADWTVSPTGGDADIVNTSLVQDTSTGAEEARRYFDSIVDRDGRLAVSAAGNYVNLASWAVGSPGTGYNVLTVGGVDDRGTGGRQDDRIWYVPGSNGSNYLDRPSDPWNAHGDYNKPNLVAPAVNVRTANGLAASGTSVATPIVAGVAAQVLANEPVLAAWPEAARAVLMAGAVHRVRMPNGSRNVDHEGVGMISAAWANRVAHAGDNRLGGYRLGELNAGEQPIQPIDVLAGDRLRVALAWNSRVTGSRDLDLTDRLRADLDLQVTDPSGRIIGSYSLDNAYEFVEIVMPSSGVARLQILQARFDGASETYGLAWAKVRETQPPKVRATVPVGGEPWAVPGTTVTASFNEGVNGVSSATFRLIRTSSGEAVPADVTYDSPSRTAMLEPLQQLPPGEYRAVLRSAIKDRAGNRLRSTGWSFRVSRTSSPVVQRFWTERRLEFTRGMRVGYRFDASGNVTASVSRFFERRTSDHVSHRRTQPALPGIWLRLTDGPLAGYWVRESKRAGLVGSVGLDAWKSSRRVVIRAGTHIGQRFDEDGSVTARRRATTRSGVRVNADARAVINGAWHLHVVSGTWSGYWLRESGRVHVRGKLGLTDIGGRQARIGEGSRRAYRYAANGRVVGSRTVSLATQSSAPALAWAIINGRPSVYMGGGGWAGHWLPETNGVWVP